MPLLNAVTRKFASSINLTLGAHGTICEAPAGALHLGVETGVLTFLPRARGVARTSPPTPLSLKLAHVLAVIKAVTARPAQYIEFEVKGISGHRGRHPKHETDQKDAYSRQLPDSTSCQYTIHHAPPTACEIIQAPSVWCSPLRVRGLRFHRCKYLPFSATESPPPCRQHAAVIVHED